MKHLKKILFILCLIPCIFLLNGCDFLKTEAYVTNIVLTETVGQTSTYTIYFSNGTHSTLTVNNGEDGKDGSNLTIETIEDYCTKNNINFKSFMQEYLTIVQVVEKAPTVQSATNFAINSTVTIWSEFPTSDYRGTNKSVSVGCGSGVIYKMESTYSYIITNYHVVYMECDTANNIAKEIHVFQYGTSETCYRLYEETLLGGKKYKYDEYGYPDIGYGEGAISAKYIGGELYYDLAVLQVPTNELLKYNPKATAVTIADSYEIGTTAIAIGNPEGEGTSVTSGIVSVVSEELTMEGADEETVCDFRVMRIDTAINGGNSGGGLFNINGELIGIVNAKVVSSSIDNIAYALPHDNVVPVVNNLIYYYDGTTPSTLKQLDLGITHSVVNSRPVYNEETGATNIYDELMVETVVQGGVGSIMQLKTGDIVKTISINGTKTTLTNAHQLNDILLNVRAGDKIIIQVEREGFAELQSCSIADANGILPSYLKTMAQINN